MSATWSKDWARDEKGNIIVHPLVGFETMIVESKALALRMPFLVFGDQPSQPSGNIQFIINDAPDMRAFGKALIEAADRIEAAQKKA